MKWNEICILSLLTVTVVFAKDASEHNNGLESRTQVPGTPSNEKYLAQCGKDANRSSAARPSELRTEKARFNEALAKEVEAIFKKPRPTKSCASCHNPASQEGSNKFADILNPIELKKIINLEKVNQSLLHQVLQDDSMPLEGEKLSQTEKDKVLEWLKAGAPNKDTKELEDVGFISESDRLLCLLKDLRTIPQGDRRFIRYFSLAHLYNAGKFEELGDTEVAINRLMNSLTFKKKLSLAKKTDRLGTLLRIDLRDFDWSADTWDLVLEKNPYGIPIETQETKEIYKSCSPYQNPNRGESKKEKNFSIDVRADWFVFSSSKPPLYNAILGLPGDKEVDGVKKFQKLVGVGEDLNRDPDKHFSVGVRVSGVSNNNRRFDRFPTYGKNFSGPPIGYYYSSKDFDTGEGNQNIFAQPLDADVKGGEFIASIPKENDRGEKMNAQVYLLANAAGVSLAEVPSSLNIVSHKKLPRNSYNVINGQSCFDCHDRDQPGIIAPRTNELAEHIQEHLAEFDQKYKGFEFGKELLRLFKTQAKLDPVYSEDQKLYKKFQDETGGKPGIVFDTALRFDELMDEGTVAAELGLTLEEFRKQVAQNKAVKLRLAFNATGFLPRKTFQTEFKEVIGSLSLGLRKAVDSGTPLVKGVKQEERSQRKETQVELKSFGIAKPGTIPRDTPYARLSAICSYNVVDTKNLKVSVFELVLKFSLALAAPMNVDQARPLLDEKVEDICAGTCDPKRTAPQEGTYISQCHLARYEHSMGKESREFDGTSSKPEAKSTATIAALKQKYSSDKALGYGFRYSSTRDITVSYLIINADGKKSVGVKTVKLPPAETYSKIPTPSNPSQAAAQKQPVWKPGQEGYTADGVWHFADGSRNVGGVKPRSTEEFIAEQRALTESRERYFRTGGASY